MIFCKVYLYSFQFTKFLVVNLFINFCVDKHSNLRNNLGQLFKSRIKSYFWPVKTNWCFSWQQSLWVGCGTLSQNKWCWKTCLFCIPHSIPSWEELSTSWKRAIGYGLCHASISLLPLGLEIHLDYWPQIATRFVFDNQTNSPFGL